MLAALPLAAGATPAGTLPDPDSAGRIEHFSVPPGSLGEAPGGPCFDGRVAHRRPAPPPENVEPIRQKYAGWLTVDLAPGADNTAVAPATLAHTTAPIDLAALAPAPLQGTAADIARVRSVFERARTEKSTTRIALWGDSHTTGDNLLGQLRRVLQARYGDGGTGFVWPFGRASGTTMGRATMCSGGEWMFDAVSSAPERSGLGLSGVAATSSDPAAFAWVSVEDDTRAGADHRAVLQFFRDPGAGTLRVSIDSAPVFAINTAGLAGPGTAIVTVAAGSHRLTLRPAGDGPVRLTGIALERDTPRGGGVVVDGLGVVGRPLAAWNTWPEAEMAAWMKPRPYDLFLLVGGSNDARDTHLTPATFRATTVAALAAFRRVAPEAACVLIGPADRALLLDHQRYVLWQSHPWINAIFAEVAPAAHCATWNLQAAMGGEGSAFAWRGAALMAPDLLHFTPNGYRELGNRLLALLDPQGPS